MNSQRAVGARQVGSDPQTGFAALIARFLTDETAQDIVEYALLTATIGLASAGVWVLIGPIINSAYSSWNNNLYNLWESPDPS